MVTFAFLFPPSYPFQYQWKVERYQDQRMIRENPFFISRSHRSWALSLHQRRRTKNKQQETNKKKVSILQAGFCYIFIGCFEKCKIQVQPSMVSVYRKPNTSLFFLFKNFLNLAGKVETENLSYSCFLPPSCTTTFPAEHSIINII